MDYLPEELELARVFLKKMGLSNLSVRCPTIFSGKYRVRLIIS